MQKVTYEELVEALEKKRKACEEYEDSYFKYLHSCLTEVGMECGNVVKYKKRADEPLGVLKIIKTRYNSLVEYAFYPFKKDGGVSVKAMYIDFAHWKPDTFCEQLKECFERVGDSNES